jgi:hypothetical protein
VVTTSSVRPRGKFAEELPYLLLGATSVVSVPGLPPIVGLPLVFALLVSPLLFRLGAIRGSAWLLSAGTVSILAYMITTELNGVSPWQRSLVILAANLAALVAFRILTRGNLRKIIALIAGHSAAWLILTIIAPTKFAAISPENLWKFGIAVPVTIVILYVLGRGGKKNLWLNFIILAGLGIFSIALNFRSHGLACLLAAAVFLIMNLPTKTAKNNLLRRTGQTVLALIILLPMSQLPAMMESGVFGQAVQGKALAQSEGGPAFLAGRTEPAMSYAIIRERPLMGWGSVDQVPIGLVAEGRDILAGLGVLNTGHIYEGWFRNGAVVTLHSILAQIWVEGGFFSAIFLIVLMAWGILSSIRWRGVQGALIVYLSFQIIWDTLFSPHTTYTAILWGMVAALFSLTGQRPQESKVEKTVKSRLEKTGARIPIERPSNVL